MLNFFKRKRRRSAGGETSQDDYVELTQDDYYEKDSQKSETYEEFQKNQMSDNPRWVSYRDLYPVLMKRLVSKRKIRTDVAWNHYHQDLLAFSLTGNMRGSSKKEFRRYSKQVLTEGDYVGTVGNLVPTTDDEGNNNYRSIRVFVHFIVCFFLYAYYMYGYWSDIEYEAPVSLEQPHRISITSSLVAPFFMSYAPVRMLTEFKTSGHIYVMSFITSVVSLAFNALALYILFTRIHACRVVAVETTYCYKESSNMYFLATMYMAGSLINILNTALDVPICLKKAGMTRWWQLNADREHWSSEYMDPVKKAKHKMQDPALDKEMLLQNARNVGVLPGDDEEIVPDELQQDRFRVYEHPPATVVPSVYRMPHSLPSGMGYVDPDHLVSVFRKDKMCGIMKGLSWFGIAWCAMGSMFGMVHIDFRTTDAEYRDPPFMSFFCSFALASGFFVATLCLSMAPAKQQMFVIPAITALLAFPTLVMFGIQCIERGSVCNSVPACHDYVDSQEMFVLGYMQLIIAGFMALDFFVMLVIWIKKKYYGLKRSIVETGNPRGLDVKVPAGNIIPYDW